MCVCGGEMSATQGETLCPYITTITNEFATLIAVLADKGYTFTFEAPAIVHGTKQYGYCAASNGALVVSFCEGGEIIVRTADHVFGDDAVFTGDLIGDDETGDLAAVIALVSEAPKSPEFSAGVVASKEENTTIRNNPYRYSSDLESKLEWAAGWLYGYDGLSGHTGYLAARVAAYATYNHSNGWSPVVECTTNKALAQLFTDETTIEEAVAIVADNFAI